MTSSPTITGTVKWFNSRAGYGFITIVSAENEGTDIFVHHSSLKCNNEQYKYLVTGEYVEFNLTETNDPQHKFQADGVTGICKGRLMCETRNASSRGNVNSGNNNQQRRKGKESGSLVNH